MVDEGKGLIDEGKVTKKGGKGRGEGEREGDEGRRGRGRGIGSVKVSTHRTCSRVTGR